MRRVSIGCRTGVQHYVLVRTLKSEVLQFAGDGFSDQLSVKPTIFNEYLVGVHAGNDDTGEVNSGTFALQSFGIGARALCFRLESNSCGIQKLEVGLVADQRKNEVIS